jgi:hypothetical protein
MSARDEIWARSGRGGWELARLLVLLVQQEVGALGGFEHARVGIEEIVLEWIEWW